MIIFIEESGRGWAGLERLRARLDGRSHACLAHDAAAFPGEEFEVWRDGVAGMIDAAEGAGVRRHLVVVPERWRTRWAEAAFMFRRRSAQSVFVVGSEEIKDIDTLEGRISAGAGRMEVWEPTPPRIETPRLVLTFGSAAQIEGYYHAIVGTDMFENLFWDGPGSVEELCDFALGSRQRYVRGPGHDLNLAIIEREGGRMIGGCSLRPGNPRNRSFNLGYTLAPAWQGQGLGTEAIGALVEHAFVALGAERCWAEVFVGNERSRRLLERLGFALEGTTRSAIAKGDRRRDEWILGLPRAEWEARRGGSIKAR